MIVAVESLDLHLHIVEVPGSIPDLKIGYGLICVVISCSLSTILPIKYLKISHGHFIPISSNY
jgi:hypothetical protein